MSNCLRCRSGSTRTFHFCSMAKWIGAHPELAGKPARIEVRCTHMPDSRALELLGLIHDQLAFQDIKMEVVVRNDRGKESVRAVKR